MPANKAATLRKHWAPPAFKRSGIVRCALALRQIPEFRAGVPASIMRTPTTLHMPHENTAWPRPLQRAPLNVHGTWQPWRTPPPTAYLMMLTRSDNLCQLASAMCFKVCATIVEDIQTALNGKLAILGVLLTHYVKRGRPNLRSHKNFLCAKRWLLK